MTQINRETGFGFWNAANDYLAAAEALHRGVKQGELKQQFSYPILHLTSHAFELFLKAMLRNALQGKQQRSHDIQQLLEAAKLCGLELHIEPDEQQALVALNAWYGRQPYSGRYHITGSAPAIDPDTLFTLGHKLQSAARSFVSPSDWRQLR